MLKLFPSGKIGRFVAVMWILGCVWLLVYAIQMRNSTAHGFRYDQLVGYSFKLMAFPSSSFIFSMFRWRKYLNNDPRMILLYWSIRFIVGYIQWFVIVPLVCRMAKRKLGRKGANNVRCKTTMLRLFPSGKIGRFIAALWILACVSVVVHTILFRNASPYNFGDAQVVEWACMSMLSFPSSLLFYSTYAEVLFNWLGYPGNDPRTILFLWSIPFIAGYIQWFVLVPLVTRLACRRFGDKESGRTS